MKSFFFGSSDQPLYGVYHPPKSPAKKEGVLLCYPFGNEYMRAHRAFRQVALLLNRYGYHVMRFDYFGTGDSAGEGDEVCAHTWIKNISQAVDELRAQANISTISLVGLRIGATLAAWMSANRPDIRRVVLWDPPLSGEHYIENITSYLRESPKAQSAGSLDGEFYMNGFPVTSTFKSSLREIDLEKVDTFRAGEYFLVVSDTSTEWDRLAKTIEQKAEKMNYQVAKSPGNWNFVDDFGGVLIPHAIIQAIVGWFQHLDQSVESTPSGDQ